MFEGRYGGVDRPVIGAHAEGFNTGSVGVAVIGDYTSTQLPAAAKTALEQLLAWRLDLAHVDPLSTLHVDLRRQSALPEGRAGLPARDLRATATPASPTVRATRSTRSCRRSRRTSQRSAARRSTRLRSRGSGEGQVRFTARLSVGAAVDGDRRRLRAARRSRRASGTGTTVDWTWDASAAPPDRYTWTIAAPNARSATGTLGAGRRASPCRRPRRRRPRVAPGETTTVSYTLTAAASVTVQLVSPTGAVFATLLTAQKPAGAQTLAFTPPPGLPNGVVRDRRHRDRRVRGPRRSSVHVTVDDILTGFAVDRDVAELHARASRRPRSRSRCCRGRSVVATPAVPPLGAGAQTLTWDGLLADGTRAPDGTYTLALSVTDDVTTFTRTGTVTLDTTPPAITVLSYRNLRFRVSEPATLTLVVGTKRYTRVVPKAATTQFWLKTQPFAYRLTATDAAGNTTTVRYRR